MKHTWIIVAGAASLAALPAQADAADIAFFDNATYTDVGGESANLAASLAALGHTTSPFSGITAADWSANTAGADLLIIPELDSGDLFPDLTPGAIAAISAYISGGGGLLMFDRTTSTPRTIDMLNGIFGYSLAPGGLPGDTFITANALGTAFEGGPASLPDSDATEGITLASLPGGALSMYDDGVSTSLFVTQFGAGSIGFLGFDWFELPTPAPWEDVLGRAIEQTSAPVPEPSTFALLGLGIVGLGGMVRRRRRNAKRDDS